MSAKESLKALFGKSQIATDLIKASLQNAVPQIAAETKRSVTQGSMELASALFNGHGFVPYGPGQYTPSQEQQHQQDRGIER